MRNTQEEGNNPALEKSYSFALQIIAAARQLQEEQREFVLSRQLLRSGTAIGANVEEAVEAQSAPDFLSKMGIAYKETRESHYWLRLLRDSASLDPATAEPLLANCEELLRIIGSICNKQRRNQGW